MPNYKNYENESLRQKLLKIIPPDRYGNFNGIVIDVFLRRAYEFDIPEDRILDEARNFERNIETISFEYGPETKDADWAGLTWTPTATQKGKIQLNGTYYKEMLALYNRNNKHDKAQREMIFLQMYEALIHEIYHGIGTYFINYISGTALKGNEENRRYKRGI